MQTFVDAIEFLFDNLGLIWDKTVEHLALSGAAVGVAMLVAIPLGVWLGHLHQGSFVAINVSNVGRALPSLAVISIGLGLLGVGFLNVMVALVILAAPLMLTGIRTAAVYVVATAPLAALAGGGGLGDIIVNQPTYGPEGVVAGSIAIAALAFATDGVFALLQHFVTPRGLRKSGREPLLEPRVETTA